ncbi:MAG: ORF6N domain-containing protein [Bacteroidales bacterium]|nr:ORF6N domain-containing protein [Bacteroidales bacterium]
MKKNETQSILLPEDAVIQRIYWIRGEKVILDYDLAILYGVEVKRLKEAVRRNRLRFPTDFLLELTLEEYRALRSQSATLKRGQHSKFLPFAFTELGVAMLSSILNSDKAIQTNILIMRAFVHLRRYLETTIELSRKIEDLEKIVMVHDDKVKLIFQAIKKLMDRKEDPALPRNPIGFKRRNKTDHESA